MSDVVSLFSGIGGIEVGLHESGFKTLLFCERDEAAARVLAKQFPETPIENDVRSLKSIPACSVLAAGFPCQDLSQAGKKAGIGGENSGLVNHLFRLLDDAAKCPEWLVMENVPFMLSLDGGRAMRHLVSNLEALHLRWAYRVVDARSFGLPQRRPRVILVASPIHDPRDVLFADEAESPFVDERPSVINETSNYGFYWTEGTRGVGWVEHATPPIKGGSGLGIPSPPAVWLPKEDFVGTPDISDAERLQGFPAGWTEPAMLAGGRIGVRWRLVGNAVNVTMSRWLGARLRTPGKSLVAEETPIEGDRWPQAAWGFNGKAYQARISNRPLQTPMVPIGDFLSKPLKPLSEKATKGFVGRAETTPKLVFSDRFLASLYRHIDNLRDQLAVANG